jgi:DNA-binding transcriptional LysR family regulator
MDYTLTQLQLFLKVCQTRSITRAAEELHITQPAVSIQLKNFQKQFDIPLTEVVGRQLYVTEFGTKIAQKAELIIAKLEEINDMNLAYRGELTGKIKMSVVSTGKYVMPYFLSDFANSNKGVHIEMDVTNKNSVVKSLERNEVDFSLVSIVPDHLNTERLSLLENKLYLVGADKIEIKSKKGLHKFFREKPIIYRESGSGTRQTMEAFIMKNNIPIVKKMQLTSNEAVKQAILAGMGYSFMPVIGLKNEIQNGSLNIIKIKGTPIATNWQLIWLKGKNHSPAATAFLEYLELNKKNIIDEKFSWFKKY